MAISGAVHNRNQRNTASIRPVIRDLCFGDQVDSQSQSSDDIEVQIGNTKMNVSQDALRAYKFYKEHEDWSSETEKTDYTYSRLSDFHTKEIIPGFAVRPNLCRSPLKNRSPQSFYSHTTVREEEENRRNEILRGKSMTDGYVGNQTSFYRKIIQTIFFSWLWVSTLVRTTVQTLFLSTSRVFSYFGYGLTRFRSNIAENLSNFWIKVFHSRQALQGNWGKETLDHSFIFIKRRVYTTITYINKVYHGAAETTKRRSYLWLLVPVLLLAGWWVLQNDENSIRDKFSTFCVHFWDFYEFISVQGHYVWTQCAIFATIVSGAISNVVYNDETKDVFTELSNPNADAFEDRIAALEKQLLVERSRRNAEDTKLEIALKQVSQMLLNQRMKQNNYQRCCRQPCLTSNTKHVDELQSLVADLQKQSLTDLASIRAELSTNSGETSLSLEQIEGIILSALKIYDADKTGRADYALESAGGRVVSIRCTKAFSSKATPAWGFAWFAAPASNPEEAIRTGMAPGECWAFQGSVGNLVLELSYPVSVTGFTIEHIAKVLSPTGSIDSAPQHFSVWGLQHADDLDEQFLFGDYIYQDNGETIQYFPVKNANHAQFKFVELKIISNHGHPSYTCLYRIRVHGDFE